MVNHDFTQDDLTAIAWLRADHQKRLEEAQRPKLASELIGIVHSTDLMKYIWKHIYLYKQTLASGEFARIYIDTPREGMDVLEALKPFGYEGVIAHESEYRMDSFVVAIRIMDVVFAQLTGRIIERKNLKEYHRRWGDINGKDR